MGAFTCVPKKISRISKRHPLSSQEPPAPLEQEPASVGGFPVVNTPAGALGLDILPTGDSALSDTGPWPCTPARLPPAPVNLWGGPRRWDAEAWRGGDHVFLDASRPAVSVALCCLASHPVSPRSPPWLTVPPTLQPPGSLSRKRCHGERRVGRP